MISEVKVWLCCSELNCAIWAMNAVSSIGFIGSCCWNCTDRSRMKSLESSVVFLGAVVIGALVSARVLPLVAEEIGETVMGGSGEGVEQRGGARCVGDSRRGEGRLGDGGGKFP